MLFGVPLVIDVIGRVSEYQVGRFAGHQPCDVGLVSSVAHKQLVITEDPNIPSHGDGRLRELRHRVLVGKPEMASCAASNRAS